MGKQLIQEFHAGSPLFGSILHFDQNKIDKFGQVSGGVGAIHLDPQFGREKTIFGATLVQGYYLLGLVTVLMKNNFGQAWVCSGSMEAKLIGPAVAGDTVYSGGTISEVVSDGEKTIIKCDAWIKRADGKLLVVAQTEHKQEEK